MARWDLRAEADARTAGRMQLATSPSSEGSTRRRRAFSRGRGAFQEGRAIGTHDRRPPHGTVLPGPAPQSQNAVGRVLPRALQKLEGLADLQAPQGLALLGLQLVGQRHLGDALVGWRPHLHRVLPQRDPARLAVCHRAHAHAHRSIGLLLLGTLQQLYRLLLCEHPHVRRGVGLEFGLQWHGSRHDVGAPALLDVDATRVALCGHPALHVVLRGSSPDAGDACGLVLRGPLENHQGFTLVELPQDLAVLDVHLAGESNALRAGEGALARLHGVLPLLAPDGEPADRSIRHGLAAGTDGIAEDLLPRALHHFQNLSWLHLAKLAGAIAGEGICHGDLRSREVAGLGALHQEGRALVALRRDPALLPV
mmetsp:Transcript_12923/g.41314  ORF Transcript_12923/g.41314 Transcript_12923/m.41314 type:complete len:367 (+) Transcript_12923:259-1359(+)